MNNKDLLDKAHITNSPSISGGGYVISAEQLNPDIEGTLRSNINELYDTELKINRSYMFYDTNSGKNAGRIFTLNITGIDNSGFIKGSIFDAYKFATHIDFFAFIKLPIELSSGIATIYVKSHINMGTLYSNENLYLGYNYNSDNNMYELALYCKYITGAGCLHAHIHDYGFHTGITNSNQITIHDYKINPITDNIPLSGFTKVVQATSI